MPKLSAQALRMSNVIREEVHQLDAVGAAFLALWLVIALIAALLVSFYVIVF
jgi:hypothetical protein